MIDEILVVLFTLLVALAPLPAIWAAIYFRRLTQEQNGKSWLLRMLAKGALAKAVAVSIIALFIVRSFIARMLGWDALPIGVGSTVIGFALLAIEGTSFYYALVIRDHRNSANSHIG